MLPHFQCACVLFVGDVLIRHAVVERLFRWKCGLIELRWTADDYGIDALLIECHPVRNTATCAQSR